MVKTVASFLDFCYLVRRNAITKSGLDEIDRALAAFHRHRQVFIDLGVREDISLPRQHSLMHYRRSIELFGSPNGLCSSITESKHIKAVKEPWRRSSRYHALMQMVQTISRLDRMAALRAHLRDHWMLDGTTLSYTAMILDGGEPMPRFNLEDDEDEDDEHDDIGPVSGLRTLTSISLAKCPGASSSTDVHFILTRALERNYPKSLESLAEFISQPRFPDAFRRHLFKLIHSDLEDFPDPIPIHACPYFTGRINVYHSATARFYAPSDMCGAGGMYRERIRSNPNWYNQYARHDTVFVELDPDAPGMAGMAIARVLLFFAFEFGDQTHSCALVHWLMPDSIDEDTGMWVVRPEYVGGQRTLEVIPLDSIPRAAHLLPVYGTRPLPEDFSYTYSLDAFRSYFVNRYVDHHTHEFI